MSEFERLDDAAETEVVPRVQWPPQPAPTTPPTPQPVPDSSSRTGAVFGSPSAHTNLAYTEKAPSVTVPGRSRATPSARQLDPLRNHTWRWTALIIGLVVTVGVVSAAGWALVTGNLALANGALRVGRQPTQTPIPPYVGVEVRPRNGSPQGCADGHMPQPTTKNILYTAAGRPGVAHEVALTFDDGPNPLYTPQIVQTLELANMHATFFPIAAHAQLYPDLIDEEWSAGMAIGNHTLHHEYLVGAALTAARDNLGKSADILKTETQDPCLWLFRSPYGVLSTPTALTDEIQREGYVIVNWDNTGKDWTRPGAAAIAQRVIDHLHPGAIILLHDSGPDTEVQDRSQTVEALPMILAALRERGLVSVTLPQLLQDAGFVTGASPQQPAASPTVR